MEVAAVPLKRNGPDGLTAPGTRVAEADVIGGASRSCLAPGSRLRRLADCETGAAFGVARPALLFTLQPGARR